MSATTGKSFLLALFLGGVAWGSVRVYASMCAPEGFTGFLTSLITMDSSPCQAVFTLISHSNTLYASMIAAILYGIFNGFHDMIVLFTQEGLPRLLPGTDGLPKPHTQ